MNEDPRRPEEKVEDVKRADEFAAKGTLKHFMLRNGFMPDNEEKAEAMLLDIIRSEESQTQEIERLRRENHWLQKDNDRLANDPD